jgi:hypothetical protein
MALPTLHDNLIITAIKTAFETLKTAQAATYHITAKSVFDTNAATIVDTERPAYNISEGDEEFLQEDASSTVHDNKIQVYIDLIADTVLELRKMKADAMKVIKANLQWGYSSWILTTYYVTTLRNVVDHQGNLIADRRIIIEVQYRKTAWSD